MRSTALLFYCSLLDRQARRYLRMSGQEFARKWKAKQIKNPD